MPSASISFQAFSPAMALGEPGSRGRTLVRYGLLSPTSILCSTLCLTSLKFGVRMEGYLLIRFKYLAGIAGVCSSGVARIIEETR